MNSKTWVNLSLGITILLWGSAFVGIKAALETYSPLHLSVLRFIIASITLVVIACFQNVQKPELKDLRRIFLTGLIGIAGYNIFLNYGELTVSAGAASFIINTVPIFTTLFATIFLRERMGARGYIGTLISFVGVGFITMAESPELQLNKGIIMLLLAALSQSIFFVLQKPLLKEYSSLSLICYAIWIGTTCMLPLLFGVEEAFTQASITSSLSLLYLGVFPGAIGYLTWTYILSKMKASKATTYLYLVPIVSIFLGIFWINEIPSILTIVGGGIAICGVAFANLQKK